MKPDKEKITNITLDTGIESAKQPRIHCQTKKCM